MPWSNQTGGGHNNGSGNGGGGPWGQPPRGPQRPGGGGGGGQQPPDLEEILKRGQDRLKSVIPGGGGGGGRGIGAMGLGIIILAAAGLYAFSSAYQVEADELAVETVFGVPRDDVNEAGLHFAFWPFERADKVNIGVRQVNIGSTGRGGSRQGLMLSGDQNIVDVTFAVQYSVSNPKDFLFNVDDPSGMVEEVAESAMREVVGRRPAQDIFRDDREGIALEVRQITQTILDQYGTGIGIRVLNLEDVAPPPKVADAFDEVQRAEQNEDQFQEEANRYSNKALGEARGEAAQIREDAAGYKNRIVQEAQGEAQRFLSVYEQYAKAPEVTRKRLFLETMEGVLKDSNKVIMEAGQNGGTGVVPYLPLPEISKRSGGTN
ncbi:MAG: FtsH protease activity modulator HflK [Rhizobiaceae bacterium]|nr:FtsH protease activity modulator HflK [Hyphomicrobiales bacterium]NRB30780.1 FtsH protease activity modulator HflK [Rhizobiaceae bacterium]